jgi:hypothetical protein
MRGTVGSGKSATWVTGACLSSLLLFKRELTSLPFSSSLFFAFRQLSLHPLCLPVRHPLPLPQGRTSSLGEGVKQEGRLEGGVRWNSKILTRTKEEKRRRAAA